MRVFALLPLAAAVSMQDRIVSMQSTLRNIATTAQKDGKIDENTKTAVRGFMATMNSTLVEALIAETEANQAILQSAWQAVEDCSTTRGGAFANDVTTKAGIRDTARSTLGASKNCGDGCPNGKANDGRGAALVQVKLPDYNYSYDIDGKHWNQDTPFETTETDPVHMAQLVRSTCDSTFCEGEGDCWQKMKVKCDKLDKMVKDVLGPVSIAEPDFCDTGDYPQTTKPEAHPHTVTIAGRPYHSWEAAKINNDPVYEWFNHMETFTNNHVDNYKQNREECHDLRNVHQHRVFDSQRKQKIFEQEFCAWAHSINVTCTNYGTCYGDKTKLLNDQKAIIRGEEAQFKKQQQALECALCYGNQLLKDDTDLAACDRETSCSNCVPLDVVYPDPHLEIPCSERATEEPCDDAWKSAEYGCWESYYPPNECTPCV